MEARKEARNRSIVVKWANVEKAKMIISSEKAGSITEESSLLKLWKSFVNLVTQ